MIMNYTAAKNLTIFQTKRSRQIVYPIKGNAISLLCNYYHLKVLVNKIKHLAEDYFHTVAGLRRQIHANPELSFQEFKTAALVSDFLTVNDIPHQTGVAKTGVVGLIHGNNPGKKVIALRADMDALPITEKNKIPFRSKNPGVMHACGHDVHTASLLGTAKILHKIRDQFEGTVKLIFQPSEEEYPGGARVMIEEGVLENPSPSSIFGQHVFPELEAGKVGMRSGKFMASTDEIFITVRGRGGHGAIPHKNIDPVLIGSHIVIALQQIVSRNSNPAMPSVLSIGRFIADGHTNIIPDEVHLSGIIRTFDEQWRKEMKQKLTTIARGVARSMGGSCRVRIDQGYPFLVNDDLLTRRAMDHAVEFLGEQNVVELDMRTTAEDFAYFAQRIPGCFYRLGIRNEEKGITSNLHTSTFDVDEESLRTGMGLMAWLTVMELNS
jgi:amidohydrolase